MARKSFFFQGVAPFAVLAEHLVKDEGFASDLLTILEIDETTFDNLVQELEDTTPFLNGRTVSAIVNDILGEGQVPSNVSRLVRRLNELLRDADEPLHNALAALQHAIDQGFAEKSDDDRRILGERIERLVCQPAGFARQHKAERLAESTGAELEDFQIICDIRPVFNEERSRIDGAVPVSTLIIDTLQLDGSSLRTEVRVTEQQLFDLFKKAEFAKAKLAVIKETLQEKSIVVAATSATVDERDAK